MSAGYVNPCPRCDLKVTAGQVKVNNQIYHPDCFTCNTCGEKLSLSDYKLSGDKVYCAECNRKLETGGVESKGDEIDTSSPELKSAWARCVNEGKNNWVLFGFEGKETKRLILAGTGSGGFVEFKKTLESNNSQSRMLYGALIVVGYSDGAIAAKRNKVVYVSYVGSGVSELVKAKVNKFKRIVQSFFGSVQLTCDLFGNRMSEFTTNDIGFKLMNAAGSHKDAFFDFGPGVGKIATSKFQAQEEEDDDGGDIE